MESSKKDLNETEFSTMVEAQLSRRGFLKGSAATGVGTFLALNPVMEAIAAEPTSKLLNFNPIPASTADQVIVPAGYRATPLISWGDPIFNRAPDFDPSGKQNADAQEKQFGDNTDGMSLFPISENRAVLVSIMNIPIMNICLTIRENQ